MSQTSVIGNTLNFFASVIKSGESWSDQCQKDFDLAHGALQQLTAPQPPARELPTNAAEFLETAAEMVFGYKYPGMNWVNGEATVPQNEARNVVGRILAIPGSENYHGYQKTGGDFGIIRDETGDDIDVAFSVGRFTFMVAESETHVRMAEADAGNWKRVKDVPVNHVESFLSIAMDGEFSAGGPHNMAPLELTADMEFQGFNIDAVSDELVKAQIEGEDIFVFGETASAPFVTDLTLLINRHSIENDSNTPDFILAEFAVQALALFAKTSKQRERWYGKSLSIGEELSDTLMFGEYRITNKRDGTVGLGDCEQEITVKLKSLTDFIDRRLNPNTMPEDLGTN